jgi:ligand-binding sensor domain-containing protein/serine phosphatase RsbU (regulator of sigma subunit)
MLMSARHSIGLLEVVLLLTCLRAGAQTFQFKNYGIAEGIHYPFIYSLDQDRNGYLFIGTGEGLYKFDGFHFERFTTKDSLASDFINCSFTDSRGIIWFGHNEGSVSFYNNGKIRSLDLSEISTSRTNAITEDTRNNIWIATQNDGLIKIDQNFQTESFKSDLEGMLIYSVVSVPNGNLLVATDVGLISLFPSKNNESQFELLFVENSPLAVLSLSRFIKGKAYAGTEDEGLFSITSLGDNLVVETISADYDLSTCKMVDVNYDESGNIWLSSLGNGLIHLVPQNDGSFRSINYSEDDQISKNVKTSMIDREGNLWVGSYGDGLSKLINNQFAFYAFEENELARLNLEIHSFYAENKSYWIGTNKGLIECFDRPTNIVRTYNTKHGVPRDSVNGIYADGDHLWIATSRNGIYHKSMADTVFKKMSLSADHLSEMVTAFCGKGKVLYIGTKNGLFEFDAVTKKITRYSNREGLQHNKIRSLYCSKSGDVYVGTEGNGINILKSGQIETVQIGDGNHMYVVRSICEDKLGKIWVGTEGEGILEISSNRQFTTTNGLYSNYCKSMIFDKQNRLWISHTGALSRINLEENSVEVFDEQSGMHYRFNDNASFSDSDDDIWFPGNAGLVRYQSKLDIKNEIEPALNITGVWISDKYYPGNTDIHLPYGVYKLRVEFVGISHRNAEKVSYRYLLEGHDLEWSQNQNDRFAQYNRLEPGTYTFKLIAYNSDGVGGNTVHTIQIIVEKPFWQKAWFIIFCVIIAFLIVRYIVRRRERFLRLNQEYLQKELDARTHEVVLQKELLEEKNNDIMSSIEYARNIQSSLLPSEDKLKGVFRDAFAYIKPKDIVSGDFFWVEEFDDVVLLACADCTGHGVPGAFMSLIGSALLKQVCHIKSIHSPDMVLAALDRELKLFINQNIEGAGIADGMDVAIIEYNKKTKILRIASARRPIVVYSGSERIDVHGDRFPIGGLLNEEKHFTLHQYSLKAGDSFYLFSDGLTDQFGGPKGKKLKKTGVLDMLDRLNQQDMTVQKEVIRSKFEDWMGEQPQIDDVILLGVRA